MFSMILRQLRLEQKLTQSDMAKALNISRVAYTNYELGNREPDFATTKRIAAILGTTVDCLLDNTQKNCVQPAHSLFTDAAINPLLRIVMLSAIDLSSESCTDLARYIELLKIRDKSQNIAKSRGQDIQLNHPDDERHRLNRGKSGGSRTVL